VYIKLSTVNEHQDIAYLSIFISTGRIAVLVIWGSVLYAGSLLLEHSHAIGQDPKFFLHG